jgi:protein tyrosine/serine phosphatase
MPRVTVPPESSPTGPLPSGRFRRLARPVRALAIGAALLGLAVFYRPLFLGNFGEVDPGRVYRCAQPLADLNWLLDKTQPATILNLRGGSEADAWYVAEVKAAQDRQIDFYDLPLSATRRPMRRELLQLLDLLGRCRYPLLIHCKSGADRTGMVSGLYLMTRKDESPRQAVRAFSLKYGHFPIGGPEHLQEPFYEYDAWLKAKNLTHKPELFRAWVEHDYQAPDPVPERLSIRPGPRERTHRDRQAPVAK